jgi:serpin B
MVLFLSEGRMDPDELIAQMTPGNIDSWLDGFASDSVDVFIPRFKLEYFRELKDDLTALGMGVAFSPGQADFSRMYEDIAVWISKVKHKTFVEVTEEGTEAAAVTSVEMEYSGIPETFQFRADRPFVFMIRENQSGTILFIGKIVDPTLE